MSSKYALLVLLVLLFHQFFSSLRNFVFGVPNQLSQIYPFPCSNQIKTCSSLLYQHNGLNKDQIATFYSVNKLQIEPISHWRGKQDYLVTVPCTCKNVNGTIGYFYDTLYTLQPGDTFPNVSRQIYIGDEVTFHLVCGCGEKDDSKPIVTYTVQEFDSLSSIVDLLSSKVGDIEKLNPYLGQRPQFLDVGWLLYVPMERS
ncbi:hypothetical protein R3W88_014256 [Solanum pinnatisectum]|uniref:LysM domain-containing protein n=1 Tax=Solanum pinnatisectum TaxID=50273 RepID=A0AAV9KSG9_9SOLN|nr:hypothetical protein R3W88_014256 [Solanum pinnatisectum]